MVCDLTIAADNAIFGQTGPKVFPLASFFNFECDSEVGAEFILILIDH